MKYLRKIITSAVLLLTVCFLTSCPKPESKDQDEYLIRVGERVVTVLDGIDIVTFVLSKGLSSLPIDAEFIDTGCNVVVNNQLLPCSAQENTVDTSVVGIYTVTYEIIVDENSYTYTRYVYVYNESFALQLYYYKEEREW